MLPNVRILFTFSMAASSGLWLAPLPAYFFTMGFFTYGGSYFGIVLFLLGGKLKQKGKKERKKRKIEQRNHSYQWHKGQNCEIILHRWLYTFNKNCYHLEVQNFHTTFESHRDIQGNVKYWETAIVFTIPCDKLACTNLISLTWTKFQ